MAVNLLAARGLTARRVPAYRLTARRLAANRLAARITVSSRVKCVRAQRSHRERPGREATIQYTTGAAQPPRAEKEQKGNH